VSYPQPSLDLEKLHSPPLEAPHLLDCASNEQVTSQMFALSMLKCVCLFPVLYFFHRIQAHSPSFGLSTSHLPSSLHEETEGTSEDDNSLDNELCQFFNVDDGSVSEEVCIFKFCKDTTA